MLELRELFFEPQQAPYIVIRGVSEIVGLGLISRPHCLKSIGVPTEFLVTASS